MDYENYYERLSAVHSVDFNRCFYCGCEASQIDFIPPISFIHDWKSANRDADFIIVPSCFECFDLLRKHNSATLDSRVNALKAFLASKYDKAINIYNLWKKNELDDMGEPFQKSLDAGIKLGAESIERLRFRGFDYEINGSITRISDVERQIFTVFGEIFSDYKDALEYASSSYQINKAQLSQLYFENGKSFDKAITAFHLDLEVRSSEKELKMVCRDFAREHSQNSDFVLRTVRKFMEADEISAVEALDRLLKQMTKYTRS